MIASASRLSRLLNTKTPPTRILLFPILSPLFFWSDRTHFHSIDSLCLQTTCSSSTKHPGGQVKFRRIAFRPSGTCTLVLVSCRPLVHLIIIGGTGRLITALLDGCTIARQQSIMTGTPHFSSFRHRRTVPH